MRKTRIWPEPRIVVIGGGTGTSTILRGIKEYTNQITAIISVMDDGGSTGRLRKDTDMGAPGDLRNCLISLSNSDDLMKEVLDYRFSEGELAGHSLGNIFITALYGIFGDFNEAILQTGNILKVTGKVLPVTLDNVNICAKLLDGTDVEGESNIPEASHIRNSRIDRIYSKPEKFDILEEAKDEIMNADVVILGPGSLYTSIIPNLLAEGMVKSLQATQAKVVYVANIMGQYGETENHTLKEHYEAVISHSKSDIIDYVIVNNGIIDTKIIEKYEKDFSYPIPYDNSDIEYLKNSNIKVIETPLVRVKNGVIRHDADKLAQIIFNKILKGD